MKRLFYILLLSLFCFSAAAAIVRSPKGASLQPAIQPATQVSPTVFFLEWNYDTTETNIVFEVWATQDLTVPFVLLQCVEETYFVVFPVLPQQFFKVRAYDTDNGLVSDWATR